MLHKALKSVTEFHKKNNYAIGRHLKIERSKSSWKTNIIFALVDVCLIVACRFMKSRAILDQEIGDTRLYRTWLITEELHEIILALQSGDEVEYADGLGDLIYVALGAGVTSDIPLSEVFEEIHTANMMKQKRKNGDPRMRDKGAKWTKPDIRAAIHDGRINAALKGS